MSTRFEFKNIVIVEPKVIDVKPVGNITIPRAPRLQIPKEALIKPVPQQVQPPQPVPQTPPQQQPIPKQEPPPQQRILQKPTPPPPQKTPPLQKTPPPQQPPVQKASPQPKPPPPQGRVPIVVKKFEMKSPPPGKLDGDKSIKPLLGARPQEKKASPSDQDNPDSNPGTANEPGKSSPPPQVKIEPRIQPDLSPSHSGRLRIPDFSMNSPEMQDILKNFDSRESKLKKNGELDSVPKASDFTNVPFQDMNNGFGGGGDGISAVGGSAFFNSKGYDITPWAKRIVHRIKSNWIIPNAAQVGIKGTVGVFVVFRKNGSIARLELRQSSQLSPYDQSSLSALRLSNPFPSLPYDFPNPDLEAYFIFQYN